MGQGGAHTFFARQAAQGDQPHNPDRGLKATGVKLMIRRSTAPHPPSTCADCSSSRGRSPTTHVSLSIDSAATHQASIALHRYRDSSTSSSRSTSPRARETTAARGRLRVAVVARCSSASNDAKHREVLILWPRRTARPPVRARRLSVLEVGTPHQVEAKDLRVALSRPSNLHNPTTHRFVLRDARAQTGRWFPHPQSVRCTYMTPQDRFARHGGAQPPQSLRSR